MLGIVLRLKKSAKKSGEIETSRFNLNVNDVLHWKNLKTTKREICFNGLFLECA